MIENGDGGELDINADGDLVLNSTLYNAVYLSLFGGLAFYDEIDIEDSEIENEDIEGELRKPVFVNNLNNLSGIAASKLNWMIAAGLVKNIEAEAKEKGNKITELIITLIRPDDATEKYTLLWDQEQSELKQFGVIYGRL